MYLSVVLLGLLHVVLVQGQPTNATLPSNFSKLQPEVVQRQDLNFTGFVFDLTNSAEVFPGNTGPHLSGQRKGQQTVWA